MRVFDELTSEESAIAHLHDMAMNRDHPRIAAYGRLMKRLVPIIMVWVADEMPRIRNSDDAADISQAVPLAAASFIASSLGTLAGNGKAPPPEVMKLCGKIVAGALEAMANGEDILEALKN